MRFVVVLLACVCIFLLVPSPGHAQQPSTAHLRNISYSNAGNGLEQVKIAVDKATVPQIFMIDGEKPRLVLDFTDSTFTGKAPAEITGAGLVQGIRVGIHTVPKRKTRVVIDLATGRDIEWTQDFVVGKNLLVISFSDRKQAVPPPPATSPAPAAEKSISKQPAVPVTETAPAQTPPAPTVPTVIARGYSKIKMLPAPVTTVAKRDSQPEAVPEPAVPVADAPDTTAGGGDAATGAQPVSSGAVLQEVSFDNAYTRSGEMVLLKVDDFQPPEISADEKDPPRLYCDFAGARIADGVKEVNDAGGKYVEKIRVFRKENPAGVRVVLELVAGNNYDLQQVFFKEDNLFVLIVNMLEEEK